MRLRLVLLAGIVALSLGCEQLAESLVDSAFAERMELKAGDPPVGKVGEPYRWDFSAEVKNEPFDDQYYYAFDITHGDVPLGLVMGCAQRNCSVTGTPVRSGSFPITLFVHSLQLEEEAREEGNLFSRTQDSEDFVITILP